MSEIRLFPVVNGKQEYTKQDKEHAFEVYKDFSQGNRSLRRTGIILGIPSQTLSLWNKQFDWQRLIFEEDGRNAELMRRSAEGKLVNELDRLLDHGIELAFHGTPQDKIQADMVKHMLGIMRFSPVQKVEQDVIDNRLSQKRNQIEAAEKTMTREELLDRINNLVALPEETDVVEGEFTEKEPPGDPEA